MVKYEYKLQIQLVSEGDKSEVACNGRPGRARQDPPGTRAPGRSQQECTCTDDKYFTFIDDKNLKYIPALMMSI